MKKRTESPICALIVALLLAPLVWAQQNAMLPTKPILGQPVVVTRKVEVGRCMSSPGQLDKCFRAVADGVTYTVAYRIDRVHGNIVTYLHTDDPNFKSPEGLRVGDVVVIDDLKTVIAAPGFEIYASNKSGWVPVLGFSGEVTVSINGADENTQLGSLNPTLHDPVRLRVKGFTVRRGSSDSKRSGTPNG
jgi:hypothetical protein